MAGQGVDHQAERQSASRAICRSATQHQEPEGSVCEACAASKEAETVLKQGPKSTWRSKDTARDRGRASGTLALNLDRLRRPTGRRSTSGHGDRPSSATVRPRPSPSRSRRAPTRCVNRSVGEKSLPEASRKSGKDVPQTGADREVAGVGLITGDVRCYTLGPARRSRSSPTSRSCCRARARRTTRSKGRWTCSSRRTGSRRPSNDLIGAAATTRRRAARR